MLTKFSNAAGLPELKKALPQLKKSDPAKHALWYFDTEYLLHAIQRITGKDFGPIPMNPGLSSYDRQAARYERRSRKLVDNWAAWWAWQPVPTASAAEEDLDTPSNK